MTHYVYSSAFVFPGTMEDTQKLIELLLKEIERRNFVSDSGAYSSTCKDYTDKYIVEVFYYLNKENENNITLAHSLHVQLLDCYYFCFQTTEFPDKVSFEVESYPELGENENV